MPDRENHTDDEYDTGHGGGTDPTESVAVGDGRGYGGSELTAEQLPDPPAWAIAPAPPQPPAEPGDPVGGPDPGAHDGT
ncbi:hypothetical protein AB0E08_14360 [Streptomyces sp. NPDC048281]|uniref:hypothetical protein n=1 Tax=Streptomyces sp. NPDC048281 TaxID=3154715 RepID=UPI003430260E